MEDGSEEPQLVIPRRHSFRTVNFYIACCLLTVSVVFLANSELERLKNGQLFRFAMPWETPPSEVETMDAIQSATENRIPAFGVVAAIGLIGMTTGSTVVNRLTKKESLPKFALSLFAVAVVADLGSTIWFFHALGVEFEFHPAIRLFGYAYGRTAGPIAGKLIQAAGIIYVSALLKERGRYLICVVTVAYLAAAAYNVSNTI